MSETRKPRMQDIADRVGVAKSTVSKALRNDPRISAALRARIAEAARDLGYRKNALVSALMANLRMTRPADMSPVIAFLVPARNASVAEQGPAYSEYMRGAADRCEALGYRMTTFRLMDHDFSIHRIVRILHSRGIRGVVVGSRGKFDGEMLDKKWAPFWTTFSVALLGFSIHEVPMHRAANHQFFSFLHGLRALSRKGYERVGLVDYKAFDLMQDGQATGAAAAHASGFPVKSRVPPCLLRSMDRNVFLRWFEKARPDAVFTGEPRVREWLADAGVAIPGEVGYASFNIRPEQGIAGINQHSPHVGAAAVDLVVGQLHRNEYGIPKPPQLILVEGTWVDGPTAPGRDPQS